MDCISLDEEEVSGGNWGKRERKQRASKTESAGINKERLKRWNDINTDEVTEDKHMIHPLLRNEWIKSEISHSALTAEVWLKKHQLREALSEVIKHLLVSTCGGVAWWISSPSALCLVSTLFGLLNAPCLSKLKYFDGFLTLRSTVVHHLSLSLSDDNMMIVTQYQKWADGLVGAAFACYLQSKERCDGDKNKATQVEVHSWICCHWLCIRSKHRYISMIFLPPVGISKKKKSQSPEGMNSSCNR